MEGYQADVKPYYKDGDLFVLPSYTEGFPMVLLEAALFYVPMLSFAVGGVPDAFEDGAEITLVQEHGQSQLAEAIRDFLHNPEKHAAMAARARRRVEEDYSIDKKIQRLVEYYGSVVSS